MASTVVLFTFVHLLYFDPSFIWWRCRNHIPCFLSHLQDFFPLPFRSTCHFGDVTLYRYLLFLIGVFFSFSSFMLYFWWRFRDITGFITLPVLVYLLLLHVHAAGFFYLFLLHDICFFLFRFSLPTIQLFICLLRLVDTCVGAITATATNINMCCSFFDYITTILIIRAWGCLIRRTS